MKHIIFALLLVTGCGSNAEAKPRAKTIWIKMAIVGEAFSFCDAKAAWERLLPELRRVTRSSVAINLHYDQAHEQSGPAMTLDNFWNSSLQDYWRGVVPPEAGNVRWVALGELFANGKPMYGGMSKGRWPKDAWLFTNVERGNACRNAYALAHELAHVLGGAIDVCHANRTTPDIMCWEDYAEYRDCKAPLRFDAIVTRQIRKRLGLKTNEKVLRIKGKQ